MSTVTIVSGIQTILGIGPENSTTWADLGSSPFGTWDSWTQWVAEPDASVQVQVLDDMGEVVNFAPNIALDYDGDVAVTLDISDTGTFTGEETSISFVLDTPVSYVSGRYFRFTVTVSSNSTTTYPLLRGYSTSFQLGSTTVALNDVDIPSVALDSDYYTPIDNDLGLITNVQATTIQGDPYVLSGYVADYVDTVNDRSALVPIYNSDVILDTAVKQYGTSSYSSAEVGSVRLSNLSYNNANRQFFNLDTDITWEADFRVRDAGTGQKILMSVPNDIDNEFSITIQNISGTVYLQVNLKAATNDSDRTITNYGMNTAISEGTWYNFAVVKQGRVFTLWLDGAYIDSQTIDANEIFDADTSTPRFNLFSRFASGEAQPSQVFSGNMENIMVSHQARYTSAYTPGELDPTTQSNILALNGDDFIDKGGRNTGLENYITEQRGGVAQIQSKNPLRVTVTDYQGNPWDGTVDLVLRGFPKIQLTSSGVNTIATVGGA